jgi:hypothetical protein
LSIGELSEADVATPLSSDADFCIPELRLADLAMSEPSDAFRVIGDERLAVSCASSDT